MQVVCRAFVGSRHLPPLPQRAFVSYILVSGPEAPDRKPDGDASWPPDSTRGKERVGLFDRHVRIMYWTLYTPYKNEETRLCILRIVVYSERYLDT